MAEDARPVLHWPGKDVRVPRWEGALRQMPELAVGDDGGNLLVAGDNLHALDALAATHAGAVRLVYLDPPYNTGHAFEHYDDDRAHALWLSEVRERLVRLVPLLADDGVVVAQIAKHEAAYFKVLLDEVFGRDAFVTTIAVRMSATSGFKIEHTHRRIVKNTEYLHVYARNFTLEARAYEETLAYDSHYAYWMDEGGTFGKLVARPEVAAWLVQHDLPVRDAALTELYQRSAGFRAYVIRHADAVCRTHTAPAPARAAHQAGELLAGESADSKRVVTGTWRGTTYFLRRTRSGIDQLIPLALKLQEVDQVGGADVQALANILGDWWDGFHLDMGNVEKEGAVPFKNGKKPERLVRRLLTMLTRPGDLVLDPYGGSGTTAAVAHKMGRRWIAIECGPQWRSHALPRLTAVVAGEDPTGVTASTAWRGGGGFCVARTDDDLP